MEFNYSYDSNDPNEPSRDLNRNAGDTKLFFNSYMPQQKTPIFDDKEWNVQKPREFLPRSMDENEATDIERILPMGDSFNGKAGSDSSPEIEKSSETVTSANVVNQEYVLDRPDKRYWTLEEDAIIEDVMINNASMASRSEQVEQVRQRLHETRSTTSIVRRYNRIRRGAITRTKEWTQAEVSLIRSMKAEGKSVLEIFDKFKGTRTVGAIENKYRHLFHASGSTNSKAVTRRWTQEQTDQLTAMFQQGISLPEAVQVFNGSKTHRAIRSK